MHLTKAFFFLLHPLLKSLAPPRLFILQTFLFVCEVTTHFLLRLILTRFLLVHCLSSGSEIRAHFFPKKKASANIEYRPEFSHFGGFTRFVDTTKENVISSSSSSSSLQCSILFFFSNPSISPSTTPHPQIHHIPSLHLHKKPHFRKTPYIS